MKLVDIRAIRQINPAEVLVDGNDVYTVYQVPENMYVRPIILSCAHDGTFNMNVWGFCEEQYWNPAGGYKGPILEHQSDLGLAYTIFVGHLDLWWKPRTRWVIDCDNHLVDGYLIPTMQIEERSIKDMTEPEEISDIIRTQPRWSVPAFFKR